MNEQKLTKIINNRVEKAAVYADSLNKGIGGWIADDLYRQGIVGSFTAEQYVRILAESRKMAAAIQALEDMKIYANDKWDWGEFAARLEDCFKARQSYREMQLQVMAEVENEYNKEEE